MTITVKYENGKQLGPQFKAGVLRFRDRAASSIQQAAKLAARDIEEQGRANIRAGGNFSSERWQQGLQAKISFQSRADVSIRVTHSVPYWKVFEEGRVIRGKPLLWIPLQNSMAASLKVRARDFPDKLFRVDRPGKVPLLLSKAGGPQYFGKTSVRIPRKWRLRVIIARIARNMRQYYKEAMRRG